MKTKRTYASLLLWAGLLPATFAAVATPPQLATDLAAAGQAAVIGLAGVNPVAAPEIPMTATWGGGLLILSDSPESPTAKATLYRDAGLEATGATPNRIFVYHASAKASGYLRFTVLIKNRGASAGTLTVTKAGTAGPSTNYGYTGKMAFKRWLDSTAAAGVSIERATWPSSRALLRRLAVGSSLFSAALSSAIVMVPDQAMPSSWLTCCRP